MDVADDFVRNAALTKKMSLVRPDVKLELVARGVFPNTHLGHRLNRAYPVNADTHYM